MTQLPNQTPENLHPNPLDVLQSAPETQTAPEVRESMAQTSESVAETLGHVRESSSSAPSEQGGSTAPQTRAAQVDAILERMDAPVLRQTLQREYNAELKTLEKQAKKMQRPWAKMNPSLLNQTVQRIRELRQLLIDIVEMAVELLRSLYREILLAR